MNSFVKYESSYFVASHAPHSRVRSTLKQSLAALDSWRSGETGHIIAPGLSFLNYIFPDPQQNIAERAVPSSSGTGLNCQNFTISITYTKRKYFERPTELMAFVWWEMSTEDLTTLFWHKLTAEHQYSHGGYFMRLWMPLNVNSQNARHLHQHLLNHSWYFLQAT